MFRFFAALSICILVISCGGHSPAPAKPCRISRIVWTTRVKGDTIVKDKITQSFEYDDQFMLYRETDLNEPEGLGSSTEVYTYSYSGGEVLSVNGGVLGTSAWLHEDGRVKTITTTGPTAVTVSSFTYDGNGNLVKWVSTGGPSNAVIDQTLTYTAGDLATNHYLYSEGLTPSIDITTYFLIDNTAINPWSLLASAISQPNFHSGINGRIEPWTISKNKMHNEITHGTQSGIIESSIFDSYNYDGNYYFQGKHYPLRISRIARTDTVRNITIEFSYTNCN